ncbi:MAG: DNA polymerase domain-containing protein, partial [Candidatus Bathyarchaeia archaeon]
VLQGEESEVLSDFNTIVGERDPDFVVCPRCDGFVVPYLFKRARLLGVDLQLGRERCDISKLRKLLPYGARGRVVLDYYMFGNAFGDWDLPGLVERSRFSFLPPGLAGRWSANRVIDSRNCYELIRRGYVIPENTGRYEYVRLMKEVVDRDRGGMIISPKIGVVHENVGQLDFESQYPHLILRNGLSYETVTPDGVFTREDALLPYVTKLVLDRRLRFKRLRKNYPKGSREWLWCEQRQEALKMVLVCLYGTSGCCWNRFGNVLCFEEINRRSRQALIRTKALVQRRGFEVVYADTDSIFIKKPGATRREYEEMSREIGEHLKLPIALDHHYKFLLLLPLESDPTSRMEAQKHYFGMLTNGELLTRGIECRRHDTPEFVKAFQEELIRILFDVQTAEEVRSIGYEKAVGYVHEVLDRIMSGDVSIDELVVSKVLRRPLPSYTRLFPHVSAAISLAQHGKMVREGETVDFVYVNAGHHNPLRRVAPYIIYDDDYYDREKYRDMVLDAAETVLSTFGFTRQKYGLKPKTNSFPEGLWRELREEVFLERETEELE